MPATGAKMVEYWHWHSLHYGQETFWKAGCHTTSNRALEPSGRL